MVKIIILTIIITLFLIGTIHAYIMLGTSEHHGDYTTRIFTAMLWPVCWVAYTISYIYKKIRRGLKKWKKRR